MPPIGIQKDIVWGSLYVLLQSIYSVQSCAYVLKTFSTTDLHSKGFRCVRHTMNCVFFITSLYCSHPTRFCVIALT